jgi:hypothetical protein
VVAALALARKRPGEALRNYFPAAWITEVRNYIANQFTALVKIVSRCPPLLFWALFWANEIAACWAEVGEKDAIYKGRVRFPFRAAAAS